MLWFWIIKTYLKFKQKNTMNIRITNKLKNPKFGISDYSPNDFNKKTQPCTPFYAGLFYLAYKFLRCLTIADYHKSFYRKFIDIFYSF